MLNKPDMMQASEFCAVCKRTAWQLDYFGETLDYCGFCSKGNREVWLCRRCKFNVPGRIVAAARQRFFPEEYMGI